MMKQEFERIAGYEVSMEDYNNIIEPMYMATNLDKYEFVKVVDKNRFEVKKQKSEERIELEESINAEINEFKEAVKWYEERLKMIQAYEDDYFKAEIKNLKNEIKILKNRIKTYKWVLA